jgi:hypothetical protein
MAKLVPLRHEGASDVERLILRSAEDDPTSPHGRTKTLAAIGALSATTISTAPVAAAGKVLGGLLVKLCVVAGVVGGVAAAVLVVHREASTQRALPRAEVGVHVASTSNAPATPPAEPRSLSGPNSSSVRDPGSLSGPNSSSVRDPPAHTALTQPPGWPVAPPRDPVAANNVPPPAVARDRSVPAAATANDGPRQAPPAPRPAIEPSAFAAADPPSPRDNAPSPTEPPASSVKPPDDSLREEAALLERARAALARSDTTGALSVLGTYGARFPAGRLGQEAAVLRVAALLARGDRASAVAATNAFVRAHPSSPYVARLRALVPPDPSPSPDSSAHSGSRTNP